MSQGSDGIGILTRKSLSGVGGRGSGRKSSQISLLNDNATSYNNQIDDRNWSWSYLRASFRQNKLDDLYQRYQRRLQNAYFNVFLLVQAVLSLIYVGILLYISLQHLEDSFKVPGCNSSAKYAISCNDKGSLELALPEIAVHVIISIYCVVLFFVVFNETLFRSSPDLQIVISIITTLLIVSVDMGLSIHYFRNYRLIRETYAFQTNVIVYFFLPIARKRLAVVLGILVSLAHLTLSIVLYLSEETLKEKVKMLASDAIYYFCVNAVGVYAKLLTEIAIRRAFMDRRGYIKSTIKKTYEKDQEDQLLQSILPEHISCKVKTELRNAIQHVEESMSQSSHSQRNSHSPSHHQYMQNKKPFSDLFVERHDDVTILYADIVNFTPLTVKMPADELVETLNELFGRFDQAATERNCVRIKLLGDCYYCVSGLNEPTPHHAENCVMLGLDMIEIIRDVKNKLKVDLAMRIGVHSGNILSGLLGIYKWQFDIWSKDVTIAQHMEQSGKPGRIHITHNSLQCLSASFPYSWKAAYGQRRDRFLHENNIETYFIVPPWGRSMSVEANEDEDAEEKGESVVDTLDSPKGIYNKGAVASPNPRTLQRRTSSQGFGLGKSDFIRRRSRLLLDRRSNLSGNDVVRYLLMMEKVNNQMEKAIEDMPLRKTEQWCPKSRYKHSISHNVNPYTLSFNTLESELHFQSQPDPLFKFYVACSLLVVVCIGAIQFLTVPSKNNPLLWILFGVTLSCVLVLIPAVWVGYIWSRLKDPFRELDCIPEPETKIVQLFYRTSCKISLSWKLRTVLYLMVTCFTSIMTTINVVNCDPEECASPWYYTFSCSMAVLVLYSFFRIHYFVKVMVSIIGVAAYALTAFIWKRELFKNADGGSLIMAVTDLSPLSHTIYTLWSVLLLHVMDRQMEYINRLDFIWKRKLTEEHREASMTHAVNTILIHNILPTQIAKIYLDPNRLGEGYSRTYKNVAIMFASIPNFMNFYTENDFNKQGLVCLNVLNQIITEFDQALFNHVDVEKIKVIGSTYMAACGLEVHETGRLSTTSFVGGISDETNDVYAPCWRDHRYTASSDNLEKQRKAILTLVQYASDMMSKLQLINREAFQDFKLRVGVASGLVVAGVVGSQKPLFDIWSDTVNMASRLDTQGQTGKIQVTEHGAELLEQMGVKCEFRGIVNIKGKGNMKTWFVCMNGKFEIQYEDDQGADAEMTYADETFL